VLFLWPPTEWATTLPITVFYFGCALLLNEDLRVTSWKCLDSGTASDPPLRSVLWMHHDSRTSRTTCHQAEHLQRLD
jgi:hypothetical protein